MVRGPRSENNPAVLLGPELALHCRADRRHRPLSLYPTPLMSRFLVISMTGPEQSGLILHVTRAVMDAGCQVGDSRMSVMGGNASLMLAAHGEWNQLARLETGLNRLGVELALPISVRRVENRPTESDRLPYLVEAVALSQPGIVHYLTAFFDERDIEVIELVSHAYEASQTGAHMLSVSMTVGISAKLSLAGLREDFLDYCEQLNLDAILEPVKI